jgi:hypothetical protein
MALSKTPPRPLREALRMGKPAVFDDRIPPIKGYRFKE